MSGTAITVRPYRPGDESSVIRIWQECGLVTETNDPAKDIRRKLKVDPQWFLVGELDGSVVATCMTGYEGHRGWINYLAVSPGHQRMGIASMMMERAENILRDAGCPKINLQVRESNTGVIEFYRKIGYGIDPVVSMGKRLVKDE